ncbi:MAG: nitrate reductase [Gammaproteobacteria bacterium]|nr:MAG: nitrate reductase [Gammaproteobacteria bacterium]
MDLLEFARGPVLYGSLMLFLLGTLWRLSGVLFMRYRSDLSKPRRTDTFWGGTRTVFTRFWPRREFFAATRFQLVMAYTFHIGLAVVVFFFVPHIEFIEGLLGIAWPGLSNDIILLAGALTVGALLAMLIRRLGNPTLRLISRFDDYFSWLVTILPVATGLMAYAHLGPRYETMLAIHILSVSLLFAWFPFGKLMHAVLFVPSRALTGASFERKGVRA